MQAYNFNDPALAPTQQSSDSYDAFWDNLITTGTDGKIVTNLNSGLKYCTIQSALNAATANDVIEVGAGIYNERVIIGKSLTLQGVDSTTCIMDGTGLVGTGSGIYINNGITDVNIKKLKIQDFTGSGDNSTAALFAASSNNRLFVEELTIVNNPSNHGIFCVNPSVVDDITITKSTVRNHGPGLRGIVIWDNLKTNITITDNTITNNSCCGIELQDGDASAVNISGNIINIGNGDNALGLTGMNPSMGANTINNNIITGGGRFGIEIKNPAGGVTVSGNQVTMTTQNGDLRDRAGIAILRRGVLYNNVDVPNDVTITGNTIDGYQQAGAEEGFGIVVEGINHIVTGNTVQNCEVGILQQQNPTDYPSDANTGSGGSPVLSPNLFGRGNSPITCGNTISGNSFSGNGTDTRDIGVGYGVVTNTNTSEYFCSIQAAINDAQTLDGHTLQVSSATFNENIAINKDLTIQGNGPSNTILTLTSPCAGNGTGVNISAANASLKDIKVTNYFNGVAVSNTGIEINNVEILSNCNAGLELSAGTGAFSILNSKLNSNKIGFRKGTAPDIDGFTMTNCEVKSNSAQGCFIAAENGTNLFNNVNITNSNFSDNLQKGMYFEVVSNAVLDGIIMNNSGYDPAYGFNTGIDINLKYGTYTNITLQNSEITNCGTIGTAVALDNPAAVAIKARDDGGYSGNPATLSNVNVKNNIISGPRNGIRFGEFGTTNNGPTNVIVNENDLGAAFVHKAFLNNTTSVKDGECNWWGTNVSGDILAKIVVGAGVDYEPFLATGTDGAGTGFQPTAACSGCGTGVLAYIQQTNTYYCTFEEAVAAAGAGETVELQLGSATMTGPLTVDAGQTYIIRAGTTLNTNGQTITNNGTIELEPGATFTNTGIYQGDGQFIGDFINEGTVKPGN